MGRTVRIERMGYGSEAIGHLDDGKTVFVEGAAPGELVSVEVTEERQSFDRARLVEVLEPSAARDAKARAQAGAPWAHLTYEAQLEAKRGNVVAALVHTAGLPRARAEEAVRPCAPCRRRWGYRNKIELHAGADAAGRLLLGLAREGTHELVCQKSLPLAHDAISKACPALQGALRYASGSQDLLIHRVGVRHSLATGELEVALWTEPGAFPRKPVAKTLGSAVAATGIVRVLSEPGRARAVKGLEVLAGRGRWTERLAGFAFEVSAPSFFQVNTAQAEKMVAEVLGALGDVDGAVVADLYAGAGTFSIPLAAAGAEVVSVESAGSSVRDLRRNAEANAVDVEVVGGDAARELPGLGRVDALVVDPPRAGLAREVVQAAAELAPARVVYVSCDPATWARDVARLEQVGFRLVRACPVDLFPQTHHIETVSTLLRA